MLYQLIILEFINIIMAAMSVVIANRVFRYLGFALNANFPPIIPPTIARQAVGKAQARLKFPWKACPIKPANAVAATNADAVPTAIRIDTPHTNTIRGTRNDPPETPTIPEKKPVAMASGTVNHRLITYRSSPFCRFQ